MNDCRFEVSWYDGDTVIRQFVTITEEQIVNMARARASVARTDMLESLVADVRQVQ